MSRRPPHSDPVGRFRWRANRISEDLKLQASAPSPRTQAVMVCADSRDAQAWDVCLPNFADGCVSSPPYLNNFDYADATRLELYFWGDVRSWGEMCREIRSGMVIATTQQSRVPVARDALESLRQYGQVGDEITVLTKQLTAQRKSRKRGKEYDQVIPSYFLDILRLSKTSRAHFGQALRPSG